MAQTHLFHHTWSIFDRLWQTLPPLIPRTVVIDMGLDVKGFKNRAGATVLDLENSLISWGKTIWPHRRAFHDLSEFYEEKVGYGFLGALIPLSLRDKCYQFREHGGTFRDILSGPSERFFTEEERGLLRNACMAALHELRSHTMQGALSVDRERYETYISKYQETLCRIERALEELRHMAAREESLHPALAQEIRAHIRSCEYGLCALGPRIEEDAVIHAKEHFLGRKQVIDVCGGR